MAIVLEKSDSESRIVLEGAIDIGCAAELKTVLLEALQASIPVSISIEGVTYVDVTAIQLLWAARSHADRIGAKFHLPDELPEVVAAALAEIGLSSLQAPVAAG
jgi:anti-anti-sigma factor